MEKLCLPSQQPGLTRRKAAAFAVLGIPSLSAPARAHNPGGAQPSPPWAPNELRVSLISEIRTFLQAPKA